MSVCLNHEIYSLQHSDRSTTTGKLIDSHLTRAARVGDLSALHLLFVSNRWERKSFLEETLNSGKSLVCDRYSYSGVAYSIANGKDYSRIVCFTVIETANIFKFANQFVFFRLIRIVNRCIVFDRIL